MIRAGVFAAAAGLAAAAAGPCFGQPLTREELQTALAQRDQQIAALEKRIAALESRRGDPAPAPNEAIQTVPTAASTPPSQVATAAGPSDDEVSLQALSRGLVQRGLQLLPAWNVEFIPGAAYSHTQNQGLVLVDTPEGISQVSDQRLRDDALETSASVRVGLPWRSQFQITAPFEWKRDDVALGDGSEVVHSGDNVGDLQLELSHQFVLERGWLPDVIGAVSLRAPTGSDPYKTPVVSVATGAGSGQVTGRLTALKTLDPLVLFSTLSYGYNFTYRESFGRVHAGNDFDWQLGGLLAVSPDTSLSFGFDQQFRGVTRDNGKAIAGSDGVAAVAQFGLDQVINSRTLLDISLGVGVTRDAPDYTIMVSLPIRLR
jgi:hypothetical protein